METKLKNNVSYRNQMVSRMSTFQYYKIFEKKEGYQFSYLIDNLILKRVAVIVKLLKKFCQISIFLHDMINIEYYSCMIKLYLSSKTLYK